MTIEIVDFPIENGGSFHSYVSLPEGMMKIHEIWWFMFMIDEIWFMKYENYDEKNMVFHKKIVVFDG